MRDPSTDKKIKFRTKFYEKKKLWTKKCRVKNTSNTCILYNIYLNRVYNITTLRTADTGLSATRSNGSDQPEYCTVCVQFTSQLVYLVAVSQ